MTGRTIRLIAFATNMLVWLGLILIILQVIRP